MSISILNTDAQLAAKTVAVMGAANAGLLDLTGTGAGQIKFPASQNASSDANTLDDYEEGTWTPTDGSGDGLVFTSVSGYYVKIGQLVTASFSLTYPSTVSGTAMEFAGLPFTSLTTANGQYGGSLTYTNSSISIYIYANSNSTLISCYNNAGVSAPNSASSLKIFRGTLFYRAAN